MVAMVIAAAAMLPGAMSAAFIFIIVVALLCVAGPMGGAPTRASIGAVREWRYIVGVTIRRVESHDEDCHCGGSHFVAI
jgi:hypothetical protein